MDPVRNPYNPGAGRPPPALAGRNEEVEAFDIAVQRFALGRSDRSWMLTGLRGVGKTVLLGEFARIAEGRGWVHQQIEVDERYRFPSDMERMVRRALLRLSAGRRLADQARRALGVLKSFRLTWQIQGGDLTAGLDPVPGWADSGVLNEDLTDLFIEVGELARARKTGVLFTIDEIQQLRKEHLAALIVGLHRISQKQLPFMVAGAGLPSLPGLAGEARSYAERLFVFRVVNSLAAPEAEAALVEPAEAEGARWHPEALEKVVAVTEGYPYFLQEFGKQSWDAAPGPEITPADVEVAVPAAFEELNAGFFRVRMDQTTDAERAYLKAMASLGSGPCGSGEAAAAMGKTTGQAAPIRDSLIKKGLCYSPRYGVIAFTVPMLDRFIRRSMV